MKCKTGCIPVCIKWDVRCDILQTSCRVKGLALRALCYGLYWRVLEASLGSQALLKLFKMCDSVSGDLF